MSPPIEVFALIAEYNQDTHPDKVNVSVGGKFSAETCVTYLYSDYFEPVLNTNHNLTSHGDTHFIRSPNFMQLQSFLYNYLLTD